MYFVYILVASTHRTEAGGLPLRETNPQRELIPHSRIRVGDQFVLLTGYDGGGGGGASPEPGGGGGAPPLTPLCPGCTGYCAY